jgi:hypothetical protein
VKVRTCAEPGCGTRLSRFNYHEHCWNHQDWLELVGVMSPLAVPPRNELEGCSPRFRKGIPGTYAMSEADVAAYQIGAWLGATT